MLTYAIKDATANSDVVFNGWLCEKDTWKAWRKRFV